MAWTAPRTYVTGEIVTASILNTDVRDNLLAVDQHQHTGAAGDGARIPDVVVMQAFVG